MLGRSFGRVEIGKRHLLLSNDVTAYAKLREDELNRILLKDRARIGRVVDTRPAGTLVSRCVLRTGVDVREVADPKTFAVPTLSLRAYDDVICLAGQVVLAGNLILPDTYRHNQYERLRNRRTAELAPRFAQPKRPIDDARRLPGAYFYLDTELRDHFGHAMTEQLPRLWAWDRAKADEPDLRALVSLRSDRRSLSPWQVKLLEAAGVDEADIVTFRGAVRVEHLVGATSMFSMPSYVHPDLAQLWNRVGRTLENQSDGSPFGRRIFVSRRPSTTRPCHNVGDVERLFAAHGFDVVFPEDCDLPTQAAMFRSADVVAGFGGSGMFSVAYCESPLRLILLVTDSYRVSNEYMISSVRGHVIDQVASVADIAQPASGWSGAAFHSGFTFDFGREGAVLRRILRSLDHGAVIESSDTGPTTGLRHTEVGRRP